MRNNSFVSPPSSNKSLSSCLSFFFLQSKQFFFLKFNPFYLEWFAIISWVGNKQRQGLESAWQNWRKVATEICGKEGDIYFAGNLVIWQWIISLCPTVFVAEEKSKKKMYKKKKTQNTLTWFVSFRIDKKGWR